ncbi:bifunctional molybdenum cofactor biosynthesis protein MoaC/MoaB [Terrimonas sp. NA20]|uniref:Bifunctional molybdenum cofactor biosynthesis protein MoaC/MoaB n=1 Tax=Terrimonas ginsenosidimutans TaxID=2908004 RepID=A0ABS9KP27_9BACT|nr:bifunctional molybdenum cofactor biosynthesis protein MoaC/MoaB [Terrimonas ginsenosidimutans]MCG2614089.1 bifunctional molybdenum cofactor biosynthesis protein MoaC/MoaB [Terrimonas ginsenosidimutans]
MVDITHKQFTLRKAIALAIVKVSSPETIAAIEEKRVPKGDVFEFSRAAGLFAVKKTSDVVPDCHPLPVEYTGFNFVINEMQIEIRAEVHTVYKTGVEVEAMHGAMIAALTMYDMLKPIDKEIEIRSVKLESKTGGKSNIRVATERPLKVAIVVCSDRAYNGVYDDISGKLLAELIGKHGLTPQEIVIVPDEIEKIQAALRQFKEQEYDLLLFSGGTGASYRDVTPEAIKPLLDLELPGLMEAARQYGQQRTPFAMLSRGIAGFAGNMLVITMPGSPRAVEETTAALFPYVLHLFKVRV